MDTNCRRSSNGRINIIDKTTPPNITNLFGLYDKIPAVQCATYRDPTEGIWNKTQLSDAFFSSRNIHIIQNGIRAGIYKRSKNQYTIGYQDCDALQIIMRSVFLQHSVNQSTHISQQITALNQIVLDYCIEQVYGEARGYMKYLHDVSTLAVPPPMPVMASQRDKKNYKMPDWF